MPMEGPTVSVGMPAYNGEAFIGQAIESILSQTFDDLELVISDNASTDETERICRGFAARDGRIRYFRNASNVGVSKNYNRVFRLSRGRFFKWASVSDYCDTTMVEKCVAALTERPDAVLSLPETMLLQEEGSKRYDEQVDLDLPDACQRFKALTAAFDEHFMLNNMVNGLIRADALNRTRLHQRFPSSDLPFMVELVLQGPFVLVPEVLFFRRIKNSTHSSTQDDTALAKYFDPSRKSGFNFLRGRRMVAYGKAIRDADLSVGQKTRLGSEFLLVLLRNRRRLGREFLDFFAGP